MDRPHVFRGSHDEAAALLAAIEHNCICPTENVGGQRERFPGTKLCGACQVFKFDQRTIDRLLFTRRRVEVLVRQEWGQVVSPSTEATMLAGVPA
jgi:hypothetical protein